MKPIVVTKVKEVSQIRPRLGQGRAGLRYKIKTPVSLLISKLIVQVIEETVEQINVPVPKTSRIQDKIVPYYAIPHIRSRDIIVKCNLITEHCFETNKLSSSAVDFFRSEDNPT